MIDFTLSLEIKELRHKAKAFIDEHIIPNEPLLSEHNAAADVLMKDL
jgi:hypothetical protein